MTPVSAPVSTTPAGTSAQRPSGAAAVASSVGGAASVVPSTLVSIVLPQTPANSTVDGTTHTTNAVHVDAHNWPTLNGCKPNPGSDDWRALERRAFSLRLRGPFGEIDG
ncbi:MAG: hypothetical protein LW806_10605 [Planctomycetaceae bacterium]|nr:hypothetical protein [Planctomycetaceae bacterium]